MRVHISPLLLRVVPADSVAFYRNTNGIGMATAKGLTTIGAVHWFGDETGQTELR